MINGKELAAAIQLPPPGELPQIILSVSPCRSGTTVMLRVFGAMGVQSHFQPLKNVLRWQLEGEHRPWSMTAGAHRTIFLKETLGPYTQEESTFNPLQLLLNAGVPPEKLHILIHGRHPLATWVSWRRWWFGQTALDYFIAAYQTTAQIQQQAQAMGLPLTTLVYEAFAEQPPATVVAKLAARMQLNYTDHAIAHWQDLPAFGTAGSNILLPVEPPRFITPTIHDHIYAAEALHYHTIEDAALTAIPVAEQQEIARTGALALYKQWYEQCLADLALRLC
ncbi:MAG: hypothetical protein R3E79_56390 [Caldilineaceae bacterium]